MACRLPPSSPTSGPRPGPATSARQRQGREYGRLGTGPALRGPGKIGISLGSHRLTCQRLAEESSRAYLGRHHLGLEVVDSPTNFEQPPFAYENARDLLDRHPDLTASLWRAGASRVR